MTEVSLLEVLTCILPERYLPYSYKFRNRSFPVAATTDFPSVSYQILLTTYILFFCWGMYVATFFVNFMI